MVCLIKDDTEQVNESNAGEITDWDADFMKVDQAQLMELILVNLFYIVSVSFSKVYLFYN